MYRIKIRKLICETFTNCSLQTYFYRNQGCNVYTKFHLISLHSFTDMLKKQSALQFGELYIVIREKIHLFKKELVVNGLIKP